MVEEIHRTNPRLLCNVTVEVVRCCVCQRRLVIDGLGMYGDDVYRVTLTAGARGLKIGTDYVCSLACLKKFAELSIRERETFNAR